MFKLKDYQQQALDYLNDYFQLVNQFEEADLPDTNSAAMAFNQITGSTMGRSLPYNAIEGLQEIPYVCIRIPTGGGKTFVAAHAVSETTEELLGRDRSVVLWLVPTNTILEQTIDALRDRSNPYRKALEKETPSVRVLNAREALQVNQTTLDTTTTVIVSTIQSFRVSDTDGRKVYEDSGDLMSHFNGLRPEQEKYLDSFDDGTPKKSLANVLRLHHPIVIVDEAHNARTDLSFETLKRFAPSSIIEFTATPDLEDHPSNVLYSASAAELKAEDMIKLPIELTVKEQWRELLGLAYAERKRLESVAKEERNETGEYIRPVMLIKAESNRGDDALTPDVVAEVLKEDYQVSEEEIAIEYKDHDDLDGVDIEDPSCDIRYIITVQKLAEGWDCPFAYVLCSVDEMKSTSAIEQITGRVLRMPDVERKKHDDLNKAYAFAANRKFSDAIEGIRGVLVNNGFERQEVDNLVQPGPENDGGSGGSMGPLFDGKPEEEEEVDIPFESAPDLGQLDGDTEQKVKVNAEEGKLTFSGEMSDEDRDALTRAFDGDPSAQEQVNQAYQKTAASSDHGEDPPVDQGETMEVPMLAIEQGDLFEPFEETHFLDTGWELSNFTPKLPDYTPTPQTGEKGQIYTTDEGDIRIESIGTVRQQLSMLDEDDDWSVSSLVVWLDRNIPHQDITPQDAHAYLERLVQRYLIEKQGYTLEELVADKYNLKRAVESRIDEHRQEAREQAYQSILFDDSDNASVTVSPELCFQFSEDAVYNSFHDAEYVYKNHYYGPDRIGAMDSGAEVTVARFLDRHASIQYWARNPVHRGFWLQTSTDKFYPDFVCKLNDGRILVVEVKGSDRWQDAEEKRNLGQIWADRSNGDCLFVMVKDSDTDKINQLLAQETSSSVSKAARGS
ncbi:DEAD/DEAH box helicase [Salinibacter ruber]|uniref:DEAD/DEAH box helicase n=1 Tax=Salinibacter ruber TaxID=146919 RepID=UPI00216968AA|nr:DEAD/DEAH box helicase family protein [Salinibacter ruber]MCS4103180.1 type III restriction enzyme [Salinibacter ruber]